MESSRSIETGQTRQSTGATSLESRFRGCLLGGALGDALGAGIEFLSLAEIRSRFGPRGVTGLVPAYGRLGAITDDTQMTLFTAEGLIRAWVRGKIRGVGHPPAVVHSAYLRWLHTQGVPWRKAAGHFFDSGDPKPDGWLVGERWLHARRAPGNTCLSALAAPLGPGLRAVNDSKGCGGVMRVAPVGLMSDDGSASEATPIEGIFRLAVECAALTHGHPSGQLPAGVLAATIHAMVHDGRPLEAALGTAIEWLRTWEAHEETLAALEAARAWAGCGAPSPEELERLGAGWVAEEALAIAVYAALAHPADPRAALLLAVNHSGDSDSTGAICGNLLGASLGFEALPHDWLAELEGREVIEKIAADLFAEDQNRRPAGGESGNEPGFEKWWERYPGW